MGFTRTAILLAAMTGLFMAIGFLVGGEAGMAIAFIVALGMNGFAYWNSGDMVLRMHGAREVDAVSAPGYYNMVRDLAANAGLPMPRVYIMDNDQPNAFATGRNPDNAVVAATEGLMDLLDDDEPEAAVPVGLARPVHHSPFRVDEVVVHRLAVGPEDDPLDRLAPRQLEPQVEAADLDPREVRGPGEWP